MFFSYEFLVIGFSFAGLPKSIGSVVILLAIYIVALIGIIFKPKAIPIDFLILLAAVLIFFGLTYLTHPEFKYWYTRPKYGFWDYALKPSNAIYCYLFMRLLRDPNRILRDMKIAGWLMYIYFAKQVIGALRLGYWLTINDSGQQIRSPYNLAFGYSVLLYMLPFLLGAVTERNKLDIVGAFLGILMLFLGGSRGPLLCIAIFLLLYCLNKFKKSKKKVVIISIALFLVLFLWLISDKIINLLLLAMEKFNIKSRTLSMLLTGDIDNDNGRSLIWGAAINLLKKNPFGYGAMGSRHVIYKYHVAGHCHNIALEMMVDFGVFLGAALLIFLLWNAYKIIFDDSNSRWKLVFLVFFAHSCQLIMSACYWGSIGFWCCCAIGFMAYLDRKKGKTRFDFKFKNGKLIQILKTTGGKLTKWKIK